MKVDSIKIEELLKSASNVIITAHKDLDLDALGSLLGFYYISSKMDKETIILIDDESNEQGVLTALNEINRLEYKVQIKKYEEINTNKDSLLVIIDTNKKERLQNEKIYHKIKNKIILDHHIEEPNNQQDFLYSYINPDESSSCEIIADILIDLNIYIPKYIASVMLSGIMVDTNRFYIKTTNNTFQAASILKKMGAERHEIQYLFKQDYNEYIKRQELIKSAVFYDREIVVAAIENHIYDSDELAKAADTLLTFNGVEASFVIGYISNDQIGISARSLGKIDVQQMMKEFNGGGHYTEAAAQIKNKNIEEVKKELTDKFSE